MQEEEASTLGAAILAAVQAGDYATIDEAVAVMVKQANAYPNQEHQAVYSRSYALYKELFTSLTPLFKKYS